MSFDPMLDRHDAVLNAIRDATDAIVQAMHDLAQALKPAPVSPEPVKTVPQYAPAGAIYHDPADWASKDVPAAAPKPLPDFAEPAHASTPIPPLQDVPAKPLPELGEPKPA
jgi:hypothetical protein